MAKTETVTAGLRSISLDRFPWLTILCLVVAPFIGHLPLFVTGLSSNPIWTQSAAVLGVGHQLVSGWAFGDPNVGWTNQALGHLAAEDWLHGRIPWWNPDSGIGLPLAGEMQPAAFFLPFVLLLAFQNGMFWLECSMQIFAGIATYCLLRRLGFTRSSALIGALLYQFNGTFAWVPNEANLNVLPFLPMLLLGVEYARGAADGRRAIVLIALAVSGSIFGGFPEASYINGLMAAVWAFGRLWGEPRKLRFIAQVASGGTLGLLLAGPLIVAFLDFGSQTSVFDTHLIGLTSLDPRAFAGLILPFIYGPLATNFGSARLIYMAGGTGGYITALLVPFAIMGLLAGRDRALMVILLAWIVLSMMKSFGLPPVMAAMNAIPIVRDVIFYRYSPPSWELAFTILAVRGLDETRRDGWRPIIAIVVTLLAVAVSIGLAWPWASIWHWNAADRAFMVGWFYRATIAQAVPLVIAGVLWFRWRDTLRRPLLGMLLVADAIAVCAIPQLSGVPPGRVDWPAIRFLQSHVGTGRFYTLGPIAPNYGAYFAVPSLDHNYSPIASNWIRYIARDLSSAQLAQDGDIFWPPFGPMNVTTAINDVIRFGRSYRDLGVNYIVTDPGITMAATVKVPSHNGDQRPFRLDAGDSLTVDGIAPSRIRAVPGVTTVGVFEGNYGNSATGVLAISLCAGGECAVGNRNLSASADNSSFEIGLNHPITLKPGEPYTATISHRTGDHGVAIWLSHDAAGKTQLRTGTGRILARRTVELAFGNDAGRRGFRRVYHDRLMQIWQVHGAEPFYTSTANACRLSHAALDSVLARCTAPARLTRRELFMPGWQATDDGMNAPVSLAHGIAQSIPLHAGDNRVRFHFAPPGSTFAWIGFWLGVILSVAAASGSFGFWRPRPRRGS